MERYDFAHRRTQVHDPNPGLIGIPTSGDQVDGTEAELLRQVARAARAAARDHLDALVTQAEANLEVLRRLRDGYAGLDDLLVAFTAPATPND